MHRNQSTGPLRAMCPASHKYRQINKLESRGADDHIITPQSHASRTHPDGSSPPVWWRTRARAGASATASWAAGRRAAATSSGGDHPVINRRINMGGTMVLCRGRRRESGAENDCNGNCKYCLAQHFLSPGRASRPPARLRPTLDEAVQAIVKLS